MVTPACVRRVVALNRQIASYKGLARQGVLTSQEAEVAINVCEREIASVRAQGELAGVGSVTPVPAPKSGAR